MTSRHEELMYVFGASSHQIAPLTYRVEAVVDEMLEILAHADLPHQLVLVAIHSCQLTHVREDILETVRQLEGVDVAETILHVTVDDELGKTQDFTTKMEGVAEARLLSLLWTTSGHLVRARTNPAEMNSNIMLIQHCIPW